jgi:copper chaperone NosL
MLRASRITPCLRLAPGLVLALLLAGCGEQTTGPIDLRFDRATCERCRMVLSDPRHAAQVRLTAADGRSVVYPFDDIGCAVVWLETRPERDAPDTEFYVSDWRTADWIDAASAAYVPGQVTPMGYGLGAQPDAAPGTLSFAEAKAHIFDVERTFNVHGGQAQGQHPH